MECGFSKTWLWKIGYLEKRTGSRWNGHRFPTAPTGAAKKGVDRRWIVCKVRTESDGATAWKAPQIHSGRGVHSFHRSVRGLWRKRYTRGSSRPGLPDPVRGGEQNGCGGRGWP